ncbi:MAG: hypothetical protein IJ646_09110 [Clostridia bacterium]|nr:hypothetical protein [Clostridia bacterium]
MDITNEMIKNGTETFIKTFEQIKKMGTDGDGHKDTCLKLIQEVYPEYTWENLNGLLFALAHAKMIEGLTIVDGQVMEPICPKLTEEAIAEIGTRRETAKQLGQQ